ncbi:uncharacterized protein Z520_03252 [Fonsecaea multimorphosa CBS 102226]|uniref:Uncharacterized protein n=1 Tax=Fonsecaea multimorphosa CBS 102226 TaxID=1442371 RepID=A0A0D2KV14_9EURO|nr:uncharacterized protein Z520_03252 [Fonsecaea multimorphosa CBS 102226]KIY00589.1 hypothetical protein Z520_03252 [Fonsecaea multimorphosa CBS 102226]OAL18981.1 hypothetical protein AYO22_10310 [Fonsecaea multimorphosa]
MVSFTTTLLSLLPLLITSALAIPTPVDKRQASTTSWSSSVSATLIGAAGAEYTLDIPVNSEWFPTDSGLSVSHIESAPGGAADCAFFGYDGAVVVLPAAGGTVDVGTPQGIAGGVCGSYSA